MYVAKLPQDVTLYNENNCLEMEVLLEGLHKNHGFSKVENDGYTSILVGSESGVYEIIPPENSEGEWQTQLILDKSVSDVIAIDFDADGEKEIMTYSKFHGNEITIYKMHEGKYQEMFKFNQKFEFLHAIGQMKINEKNVAIVGHRAGEQNLFMVNYDNGTFNIEVIDRNCGSANVLPYVHNDKNYIVATNREIDEISLYVLT